MIREIPLEVLKFFLAYRPETGVFTWQQDYFSKKIGDVAGKVNERGYRSIYLFGNKHRAQRLAFVFMTGKWPTKLVDHINHKKDDNRWCNLRHVTHKENTKNQKMHCTNTSGVTGVCWQPKAQKWIAQIWDDGKRMTLYRGDRFKDAIAARARAESEFGYHENHGRAL